MAAEPRFIRKPSATLYAMADGSAALRDSDTQQLHALNPEAAEIWAGAPAWTRTELASWLANRGHPDKEVAAMAEAFLIRMVGAGLFRPELGE